MKKEALKTKEYKRFLFELKQKLHSLPLPEEYEEKQDNG